MIGETKLQPWVDSEVDEDGDLRLYSAIDEKAKVATYTVMSIKERKIKQWLKAQGWVSPEEKAELIEVLMLCVIAMKAGMADWNPHNEYVLERATRLVDNAKVDQ